MKKWFYFKMLNCVQKWSRNYNISINVCNTGLDVMAKSTIKLSSSGIHSISEVFERKENTVADYEKACSPVEDMLEQATVYKPWDIYKDNATLRQILLAIERDEERYIKLAYHSFLGRVKEKNYEFKSNELKDIRYNLQLLKILSYRLKNKNNSNQ